MQKTKQIIPYIIICALSLIVFFVPFGNADELWNYNFARNISMGLLPYKDFSIVQTPLSAYFASVFIIIFGPGLISVRVLGYFLFAAISCLSFRLFRDHQNLPVSCVAIMFSMSLLILPYIYNYNYLSAFLILLIIKLEGDTKLKNVVLDTVIGIIVGLLPLVKQSTGAVLFAGNIVVCVIFLIQRRKTIKEIAIRLSLSVLPGLFYLAVLILTGSFSSFYEYAIKGIKTFVHRYSPIDLFVEAPAFGVILLILVSFIILILTKAIRYRKELTNQQISSIIMSFAWCSIAFPLCDGHHVLCIAIPVVPTLLLFYPNKKTKSVENYVCVFVSSFVAAIALIYMVPIGQNYHFSTIHNYECILISESYEKPIVEIDNYILKKEQEGYHIRIADLSAAAIKIPLDEYEKNWDMLLVGNLGENTVDMLLIDEIPTLYLVAPGEHNGLQEHRELIDYIESNYRVVDHIGWFDVYEK